ncbi:MAG: hypothetical protein Q7V20_13710 [Aquabacterium sp.]|uniref:hypothetical protein n=1 Tax=Aquabacterium sp. TaxID=1872578 RepID=UPI0027259381|nr:hypothetical protein [Aquabacterium sp.]MDO9004499.1 hypothetical protein [Aquabacterium sp.]
MEIIKLACIVALTHVLLAIVPWLVAETPATGWLPYHSYYTMAQVLHGMGLPVIGSFHEGMFMAPITSLGKVMIVGAWTAGYVAVALMIVRVRAPRHRDEE